MPKRTTPRKPRQIRHPRSKNERHLTAVPDPSPIIVRHSELADFRHCPLKHWIGWTLGYHDPVREARGNRELGSAWHRVLQIHYEQIRCFQIDDEEPDLDYINELVTEQIKAESDEFQETLFWMYDGYVEEFGFDSDWEILEVEKTLRVPFLDEDLRPLHVADPRMDGLRRPVLYEWTSDVLVRSREYRGVLVVDNKSTAQPLGEMDIDLSDQFGLYTVAWTRLGFKVRGQMVNQAKTKKLQRPMTLKERFTRYPSIRTGTELRNIEADAVATIRQMYSANNVRHPYSAPDPRSCGWKCDFKEPHLRLRRLADPSKIHSLLKSHGLEPGATHR